jgi:hypothetical protein
MDEGVMADKNAKSSTLESLGRWLTTPLVKTVSSYEKRLQAQGFTAAEIALLKDWGAKNPTKQLLDYVDEQAKGMTTPLGIGLMAAGGPSTKLLAKAIGIPAELLAKVIGVGAGIGSATGGAEEMLEGQTVKGAMNVGLGALMATPGVKGLATKPKRVINQKPLAGSDVTTPTETYQDGVVIKEPIRMDHAQPDRNIWVRQGADANNNDRVLMIQLSDDLFPKAQDAAAKYYDAIYKTREGYQRPADFWELPDWQTQISKSVPKADTYVVRSLAEAKRFLDESGYGRVTISAMDSQKSTIKELIKDYGGTVDLGGYGNLKEFSAMKNVNVHRDIQGLVDSMGVEYKPGNDYRNFRNTPTVPRLCLSTGCSHGCAFCAVEKTLKELSPKQIMDQVDAIAKDLPAKLVYLNDKTFGQAKNSKMLPEIFDRLQGANPEFGGFVVQTSASQMKRLSPEFIDRAGIKYIELGVESANDSILSKMKKPATEALLQDAADKVRMTRAKLIPNIMIGLPGETPTTYAKTLDFLERNKDIVSHTNAYNLALYDEAPLAKTLKASSAADLDENVLQKSWMESAEPHQDFSNRLFDWSQKKLGDVRGDALSKLDISKRLEVPETAKPLNSLANVNSTSVLRSAIPTTPQASSNLSSAFRLGISERMNRNKWDADKISQKIFGKGLDSLSLDELRVLDDNMSR